jgi:hypothetical protein
MNCCHETAKMGVSRGTRDTSQGPTREDARKDGQFRGHAKGVVHETSGLRAAFNPYDY